MKINEYAQAVVDQAILLAGGIEVFREFGPKSRSQYLKLAAEDLKSQYPEEYNASAYLGIAFQIYRLGDNHVDIRKAIAESPDAAVGLDIQRRIGVCVRIARQKGVHQPSKAKETTMQPVVYANGNGIVHEADEQITSKHIVVKPVGAKRTNGDSSLLDTYRRMAERLDVLPTDEAVMMLIGCSAATPGKCRELLRREGYLFEPLDLKEAKSRYHMWKVTQRGSDVQRQREEEAKRAAEAARQAAIQTFTERVQGMSADQLAQLAALLSK